MAAQPPLQLTGRDLTIADVVSVARGGRPVVVEAAARERMAVSRAVIERVVASGDTVYGVTTGFGDLADVRISPEQTATLQRNLVRSHSAGVGEPLPTDVVRAMLLLRANALAIGLSGIRPEVVDLLVALLNAKVHPVIPCRGSVGASGDLAPLAHLALVVIGEGEAEAGGRIVPGGEALAAAGLEPMELQAKEGLALLNGTQLMTAIGALAVTDAAILVRTADVTGAMSLEAMLGTASAFDDALIRARPHPGQLASAARLRELLADSEIGDSHRTSPHKVQDPYSIRCMPQVHGAVADALAPLDDAVSVELNAATDNPLVFPDGRVVSGGNFHGEPLALALDHARLALTALATISERRTARILDSRLSGLPAFLADDPGIESGLMLAQYTAAAAVNELKTTAHPAAADTIPTSANQEDHVSMGATSALLLRDAIDRTATVLAVEALCAARGLDLRYPHAPGRGVQAAVAVVRAVVPPLDGDRPPSPDITAVAEAIRAGRLSAVASA
ncbi:MAG TPA: histidine ammonia-lyase [Candidatus Limnocylindria bacterium]|nr:histidine ammonia-lyase [Candidatus Limnocylindria bacterium]